MHLIKNFLHLSHVMYSTWESFLNKFWWIKQMLVNNTFHNALVECKIRKKSLRKSAPLIDKLLSKEQEKLHHVMEMLHLMKALQINNFTILWFIPIANILQSKLITCVSLCVVAIRKWRHYPTSLFNTLKIGLSSKCTRLCKYRHRFLAM